MSVLAVPPVGRPAHEPQLALAVEVAAVVVERGRAVAVLGCESWEASGLDRKPGTQLARMFVGKCSNAQNKGSSSAYSGVFQDPCATLGGNGGAEGPGDSGTGATEGAAGAGPGTGPS